MAEEYIVVSRSDLKRLLEEIRALKRRQVIQPLKVHMFFVVWSKMLYA